MRNSVNRGCLIRRVLLLSLIAPLASAAAQSDNEAGRGDRMVAAYFRAETARLADRCLADVDSLEDWTSRRAQYRRQLFEMLSLDPLPERTELHATVTGRIERDLFTVENIQFQSRPGLYVTGNLYIPRGLQSPAPTILYVCGHGASKEDGVSFGNKVSYHHHGVWFARHGYVCLTIDTLQLGEIEGLHHGTYREGMWWWNCRGYTPAGVEAWNCIRALDYLETRDEVDAERIGVTGRSGGGAYSWWIAALDERIKAAVPVAGITDLQNHVVDGTVEGHCDCMFTVNTYGWDYAQVAALVAPRPLLISNSDKDRIFPLDGVVRVHEKVRRIYRLYDAEDKLGLQITEGPHQDTQVLRIHAFHWFNRFLKDEDPLIDQPAEKIFEPEQLKVFAENPADETNTRIHDSFVPLADPLPPSSDAGKWAEQRDQWLTALREKSFRGWPDGQEPLDSSEVFSVEQDGVRFRAFDFVSQAPFRLRLYLLERGGSPRPNRVVLNVQDEESWKKWLSAVQVAFAEQLADVQLPEADESQWESIKQALKSSPSVVAYVAPRGIGLTAWNTEPRNQTQIRRRFMLLGQTLDGMRVYDVRRAIQALRTVDSLKGAPLSLHSDRAMAGVTLYASLFEPGVARLNLRQLPASHHQGPIFLNVLRYLDMPQAVAMAGERSIVSLNQAEPHAWQYPTSVATKLGWNEGQISLRKISEKANQ